MAAGAIAKLWQKMLSSIPVSKVLSILLKELDLYLISLMFKPLPISYFCLLLLTCGSAANAQQNSNWNSQPANQNTGWQAPQGNQAQSSQGANQGTWQPSSGSGGWQPIGTDNQAGPSFYGNATTTQPNEQLQEPGAYLNQAPPNNGFSDTVSAGNGTQNNNSTSNNTQQGHPKKSHEGLKNVVTGMGKAFESAATVAAPVAGAAGGMMLGRAMMGGYGYPMSPYGGYGMNPYGMGGMGMGMPMMNPYGMGGYGMGMPMMNPYGMSSFMHY
jgi:hypothetical protein